MKTLYRGRRFSRSYIADRARAARLETKPAHALSLTHAHFLIMGGFLVLVNNGSGPERRRVLIGQDLYPELADTSNIIESSGVSTNERSGNRATSTAISDQIRDLICDIDASSLQDKSKGDSISKGVAILQAGWFIMSCISRGVNYLALTELEISTLAFSMVNLVLYMLWWNKPQSVGVQILIDPSLRLIDSDIPLRGGNRPRTPRVAIYLLSPVISIVPSEWHTQLRVPSLWWSTIWEPKGTVRLLLPPTVLGMLFGGVHFIAWLFYFPSLWERDLWLICAGTVAVGPAMIVFLLTLSFLESEGQTVRERLPRSIWPIIYYVTFFAARGGLLALSVMGLRDIPPSGYQTVPWLSYIPHV